MDVSYTAETVADHEMDTMVHFVWAWGVCEMEDMRDTVGRLRIDYHFSFTGRSFKKPDYFEVVAPLLIITRTYKGL